MSGSVKNRRKSPVPVRKESGDKEKGSSDGGTPHLPRPELVSSQGSQEEGTTQSGGTEDEVKYIIFSFEHLCGVNYPIIVKHKYLSCLEFSFIVTHVFPENY